MNVEDLSFTPIPIFSSLARDYLTDKNCVFHPANLLNIVIAVKLRSPTFIINNNLIK